MYLTALDIGSANIKAIIAEPRNGKLSVLGVLKQPSAGFRKGILVEPEAALNALRLVFAELRQISKRATRFIYLNVNGSNIKSYLSKGVSAVAKADSEIRQDDIDRALKAAQAINLPSNYLILHNITREFLVDDIADIIDPLGMNGTRLEVSTLAVAAFAPLVNNLVKYLEKSGGAVAGLIFNPLASSRSVLSKNQKNLGSVLVDIGFETTSVAVYEENKILNTFSLPVGSGHITNDLAVALKVGVEFAEKVKLGYGFALAKEVSRRESIKSEEAGSSEISRRFLSEIIEVRLAEIFELVNHELKAIGRQGQLPGGAVLTGGGSKLPGIIDLARQELKLPAQIGLPDLSFFEIGNAGYQELLLEPEMAAAVGLLLWAADKQLKSDFEPVSFFGRILRNLIP